MTRIKRRNVARYFFLAIGATLLLFLLPTSSWAEKITYTYDALYRLTHVTYQDGTVVEYIYDPAGNRTSMAITAPTPIVVNNFVTFAPINSTITTTSNTSGCPAGFVGKFSFNARLTDKNTSPPLSNLLVKVTALSNGNLLQNADGGPAGVGATLTIVRTAGFADGLLSANEFVDVPFVICLKQRTAFSFFVDVLGVQR